MSPMIRGLSCVLLLGSVALGGCASQPTSEQALQQAGDDFQKVKEDANVLRFAPKDVIRAGESLARADRLSSYWGSGSDVVHYAYLSQRYSAIARAHPAGPECRARHPTGVGTSAPATGLARKQAGQRATAGQVG